MTILTKESRSESSVNSSDQSLLAGFVTPGVELPHGERKVIAARLRARMAAVDAWVSTGERLSHQALAERLGMSDRCLSYQFPAQSGLYAFPPPELALSMSGASATATDWTDIAKSVVTVFVSLDTNPQGRALLAGLVRLHRAHPELADTDGYFARSLRDAISGKRQRNTLAITGLFTDGLRTAFEDWVDQGEPSLRLVAQRVELLLTGPVQCAFEALGTNATSLAAV